MTLLLAVAVYLALGAMVGEACLQGQRMLRKQTDYLAWALVLLFWPAFVSIVAVRLIKSKQATK